MSKEFDPELLFSFKPISAAINTLYQERDTWRQQVTEIDLTILEKCDSQIYLKTQIDDLSKVRFALENRILTLEAVLELAEDQNYQLLGNYAYHRAQMDLLLGYPKSYEVWSEVSRSCFSYINPHPALEISQN